MDCRKGPASGGVISPALDLRPEPQSKIEPDGGQVIRAGRKVSRAGTELPEALACGQSEVLTQAPALMLRNDCDPVNASLIALTLRPGEPCACGPDRIALGIIDEALAFGQGFKVLAELAREELGRHRVINADPSVNGKPGFLITGLIPAKVVAAGQLPSRQLAVKMTAHGDFCVASGHVHLRILPT